MLFVFGLGLSFGFDCDSACFELVVCLIICFGLI